MKRFTRAFALAVTTLAVAGPLSAQAGFPSPPANWWTGLNDGGFPSATYVIEAGFPIQLTQAIQSVEGSVVAVATSGNMMGQAMPPQVQRIDVASLTSEQSLNLVQQSLSGGLGAGAGTAPLEATVRHVEDTTCSVGTTSLPCGLYEMTIQGATSRVWHAPSVPPVLFGGIVRAESTVAGQQFVLTMQSYRGRMIRP
jgi:hypothetical protein